MPPSLLAYGFAPEEREAAITLSHALGGLESQVRQFKDALDLADYCDDQREPLRNVRPGDTDEDRTDFALASSWNSTFIHWKQLAVAMGAVLINNYAELVQSIDGLIGMVPTAKAHLDAQAMKRGRKAFYDAFPDFKDVRFGVAHAGKQFKSAEAYAKQRVQGMGTYVQNMLTDRTLYSHVNQKEVGYSLTYTSYEALRTSADLIHAAFKAVSDESLKYNSQRQRETPAQPS